MPQRYMPVYQNCEHVDQHPKIVSRSELLLSSALQKTQAIFSGRSLAKVYALTFLATFLLLVSSSVQAQVAPVCDVTCAPAPDPTISASARTLPINDRGFGQGTPRRHFPPPRHRNPPLPAELILGSSAYQYDIPLVALPGRNGLNLKLAAHYNSGIWSEDTLHRTITFNADRDNPSYGFRIDFGFIDVESTPYILTEPDGTKHSIDPDTLKTTDGSNIKFDLTKLTTAYKNGNVVSYEYTDSSQSFLRPVKIQDTNGNFISISYNTGFSINTVTDTLGRTVTFGYDLNGKLTSIGSPASQATLLGAQCQCPQPTTKTVTITWGTTQLAYSFSNLTVKSSPINGAVLNVITAITMPDGTSTHFSYGGWGIVNHIENRSSTNLLRSYINFLYPDPKTVALLDAPSYTQKTVSFDDSGTNTAVWQYSVTRDAAGNIASQTVIDPRGVVTTTTLDNNGFPTQTQVFASSAAQSANTPSRTVARTWLNNYPQNVITTLDDGSQSKIAYVFDSNGNMTDLKQYDFNASLVRETVMSYASIAPNIVDRPSKTQIKDGLGNLVSETDINYDQSAIASYTPAAAQHDDQNFSPSNIVRGNPTTITTYSNAAAGTGVVTKTLAYDVLGNTITIGGTCCVPQRITFNSDTQYAYPASVSTGPDGDPLTLTASSTYDFATGLALTATDVNGQVTQFTYDVDNRLRQTQSPDLSTASVDFDDSSKSPTVTSYNSLNSLETVVTLDGMGRTLSSEVKNRATGATMSTTSSLYDLVHGTVSVSNPYVAGETPKYTVTSTDELGRVIQVTPPGNTGSYQTSYSGATMTSTDPQGKQRKQYMDAFGQLVRVDEPGGTGGESGSGSLTIAGAEQSVSVANGGGATAGTASITIATPTTTDRSTTVLTHAATPASVTVTIGGSNATNTSTFCSPTTGACHTFTTQDSGTISFTVVVGGVTVGPVSTGYSNTSTQASLAAALYAAFPANSVVGISNPNGGNSFTLTTTATGSSTNGSTIATSVVTGCVDTDTMTCGGPGWTMSLSSSPHFTGGTDNVWTTYPDTGTVAVTITANGTNYSKSSSYGQSTTPSSIVTDLTNQINGDPSMNKVVIANASGNVLSFTTVATGAGTNYPIMVSSATNSSHFAAGSTSFAATPSGSFAFTTGQNGTVYDAGTIKVTVTGFTTTPYQQTVNYSQGSTQSSIASALLGAFTADPNSPVTASIPQGTPNVINLGAKTVGADTNYGLSISSATNQGTYFAHSSFSGTAAGLSGGADDVVSMSTPLTSHYIYNVRGELVQANQGQQSRTYGYDDLGRLTTSVVPETGSGVTRFTYKDFGAVNTRTDPRGIVTTYTYDILDRLKQTTYSDSTPAVSYTYGGAADASAFVAGRLKQIIDGSGSETFQYDKMGRSTQVIRTIGANQYITKYGYSAGQLNTITYPSSRTVTITPDSIGRLESIASNGSNLLMVGTYNAAGQVTSLQYGDGMEATYGYNDQLQLQTLAAGSTTTPALNLTYNYGALDNGEILGITDNINASQSTSYVYDELGRLKSAQTTNLTSADTWKLGFKYDRYGNRLAQIPQGGTATMPVSETAVDSATNRLIAYQYDDAGNIINDGLHTYTYDAENRLTKIDGGAETFLYDAAGMRVKKNSTVYIYDGSHAIAEYGNGAPAASPTVEYVGNLASFSGGSTTYFYQDQVSNRFLANSSGTPTGILSQFPFGELTSGSSSTKWAFTNYERDNAAGDSGLDYAYARFYSSRLGRFMSMDPLPGSIGAPQSLNRYAYAMNNPISFSDPTGASCQDSAIGCVPDGGNNYMCLLDVQGNCTGGNGGGGCATIDGMMDVGCMGGSAFAGMDVFAACNNNLCIFNDDGLMGSDNLVDFSRLQAESFLPGGMFGTLQFACTGQFDSPACVQTGSHGFPTGMIPPWLLPNGGNCGAVTGTTSIISGNVTTNLPTIAAGGALGEVIGGPPGGFAGAIIGSFFGIGGTASYVPSTKSLYAGPTVVFAPAPMGGSGFGGNIVYVPPTQNPNAIASSSSYFVTFQPFPIFGSTVTKSPGSGPPVVGPSVGTRVPVSFSASYNFPVMTGCR